MDEFKAADTPPPVNTALPVNTAAMRRRARIMRAVNVPMRAVLSLPFPTPLSGNLMLVSYTAHEKRLPCFWQILLAIHTAEHRSFVWKPSQMGRLEARRHLYDTDILRTVSASIVGQLCPARRWNMNSPHSLASEQE